jgi:hypothetical protein
MYQMCSFKSLKIITSYFPWSNDFWPIKIACIGLLAFFVSFLLPVSTKVTNNIFYILVGLPVLIECLLYRRYDFFRLVKLFTYVAIFLIYLFVRAAVAGVYSDLRVALYLLVFFGMVSTLVARRYVNEEVFAFIALVALFVHAFVIAYVYYFVEGHSFNSRVGFSEGWRLGNPIHVCMLQAIFSVLVAAALIRRNFYIWALLPLLAALLVMVVYKTRSGILGYAVCGAILILGMCFKGKIFQLRWFLLLSLIIIFGGYYLGLFDTLISRGASYRGEIYRLTFSEFLNCSQLWGCGYGYEVKSFFAKGRYKLQHPHSIYMSQLLFVGIVGLLTMLMVQIKAIIFSLKHNSIWFWALVCAGAFLFVDGSNVYDSPGPIWLFFWLPIAIVDGLTCREELRVSE